MDRADLKTPTASRVADIPPTHEPASCVKTVTRDTGLTRRTYTTVFVPSNTSADTTTSTATTASGRQDPCIPCASGRRFTRYRGPLSRHCRCQQTTFGVSKNGARKWRAGFIDRISGLRGSRPNRLSASRCTTAVPCQSRPMRPRVRAGGAGLPRYRRRRWRLAAGAHSDRCVAGVRRVMNCQDIAEVSPIVDAAIGYMYQLTSWSKWRAIANS